MWCDVINIIINNTINDLRFIETFDRSANKVQLFTYNSSYLRSLCEIYHLPEEFILFIM